MAPKRKANKDDTEAMTGNSAKKSKKAAAPARTKDDPPGETQTPKKAPKTRSKKAADDGYTSQQKSAISQFQNFTQADRNTAIRWLKSSGWVPEQAVNSSRHEPHATVELQHHPEDVHASAQVPLHIQYIQLEQRRQNEHMSDVLHGTPVPPYRYSGLPQFGMQYRFASPSRSLSVFDLSQRSPPLVVSLRGGAGGPPPPRDDLQRQTSQSSSPRWIAPQRQLHSPRSQSLSSGITGVAGASPHPIGSFGWTMAQIALQEQQIPGYQQAYDYSAWSNTAYTPQPLNNAHDFQAQPTSRTSRTESAFHFGATANYTEAEDFRNTLTQAGFPRPTHSTTNIHGVFNQFRGGAHGVPRDHGTVQPWLWREAPGLAVHKLRYFSGGGGPTSNSSGSESKLRLLFDKYRDDPLNSPDVIGVDGSMQYLQAIGVDLEGLDSFAALEIIQAPSMGEISRDGFVNGWAAVGGDTIDKQKAYINSLKKSLSSDKTKFNEIYKYSFQLGKTAQQKAIPLETAAGFWELLFSSPLSPVQWRTPNSPWIDWWGEFLISKWKKSVNKDMWNETLKFAQMTLDDEQMTFWNEESSWPSVIDDFVEFVKKEKRGGGEETEAMEY